MGKLTVITLCLISLFVGAVIAEIAVEYYYPNIGTIGTFQVYINDTEYFDGGSVDWSVCQPGYMYWKNLTVVNIGNTALNVSVIPEELQSGWTLTWDGNNTELVPDAKVMGWLNLTIPLEATEWGSWGFKLIGEQT
jgi:hypothetical protein